MSAHVAYCANPTSRISWFAVKVRSRCEEAIAATLRGKQYEVLNPSSIELRQYSDRVRKVCCSLFPGYLFVAIDSSKMLDLVSTDGVQYVVRSGTILQPLSEREVRALKLLCRMDEQQRHGCKPCDYLRVGQRVRIEVGPLSGLEGVLVRVRDVERVVVTVESLHSSVSIAIGHTQIRLLDRPAKMNGGVVICDICSNDSWHSGSASMSTDIEAEPHSNS